MENREFVIRVLAKFLFRYNNGLISPVIMRLERFRRMKEKNLKVVYK